MVGTRKAVVDNHGFRYYDPEIGRYLTRDPAGYADGLNVYLYVGNNPVNHVDPEGLQMEEGSAPYLTTRPIEETYMGTEEGRQLVAILRGTLKDRMEVGGYLYAHVEGISQPRIDPGTMASHEPTSWAPNDQQMEERTAREKAGDKLAGQVHTHGGKERPPSKSDVDPLNVNNLIVLENNPDAKKNVYQVTKDNIYQVDFDKKGYYRLVEKNQDQLDKEHLNQLLREMIQRRKQERYDSRPNRED